MTHRILLAAALVSSLAAFATGQTVSAQAQRGNVAAPAAPAISPNASVEELPSGQPTDSSQPQGYYPGGPAGVSPGPNGYPWAGGDGHYDGDDGDDSDYGGWLPRGGQFYVFADYLNVRATFSDATAFIDQDLAEGQDDIKSFDFDFESSYRFGGGYRLCHCGDQIRFMYTRMTDEADAEAGPDDIVDFNGAPPPGGRTDIEADVDTKSFDLEYAKTIPLGGQGCGCGDACRPCCPAWDITWSAGLRWAEVDWHRSYEAFDNTDFLVIDARTQMEFEGVGLRTGLEGRRYFFCDGWLSIYGKGDISLLLGDVDIRSSRVTDDPNTLVVQTSSNRQLIPVTELEAGATAQVTCHSAVTAGYLMTAWHDLGFRNHDCGCDGAAALLPAAFDDANILGFDGFFARLEVGF
jgi:hypothetical protein